MNRLTDYAVVVMAELADGGAIATSGTLSIRTGIPQPTVAKLLKVMAHRGLAVAHRGRTGGYGLGRAAADISVAEIIEAVEGRLAVAACVHGSEDECEFEHTCPINGRWDKVNRVIWQALNGVSLADMAAPAVPFPTAFEDRGHAAAPSLATP